MFFNFTSVFLWSYLIDYFLMFSHVYYITSLICIFLSKIVVCVCVVLQHVCVVCVLVYVCGFVQVCVPWYMCVFMCVCVCRYIIYVCIVYAQEETSFLAFHCVLEIGQFVVCWSLPRSTVVMEIYSCTRLSMVLGGGGGQNGTHL